MVLHPMIREAMRKFDRIHLRRPTASCSDGRSGRRVDSDRTGRELQRGGLYEAGAGHKMPTNFRQSTRPIRGSRVWNMGLVLAARHLRIDLSTARVEPVRRSIFGSAVTGRGEGHPDRRAEQVSHRLERDTYRLASDEGIFSQPVGSGPTPPAGRRSPGGIPMARQNWW